MTWKALYFDGDNGEIIREEEIPEDMLEFCKEKKMELLAHLAECPDEEEMEMHYLEENLDIDPAELKECIRR